MSMGVEVGVKGAYILAASTQFGSRILFSAPSCETPPCDKRRSAPPTGAPDWRPQVLSEADARPFFRRAIESGINFFDTAGMST
jgi:hypothetical protein